MSVPDGLERYIVLSLIKRLRDDSGISALGIDIQTPGVRASSDVDDDDWLEVHLLQLPRTPTRAGTWASGGVMWQVGIFSRTGNVRDDHDSQRPWTIAGLVRAAFEGESVSIAPHGDAALTATNPIIGCMTVREADAVYMTEPALSIPSKEGVPSQPANLHGVAITFRATLVVA